MIASNAAKFIVLTIIDGWGLAPNSPGNAITNAKTPNIDKFWLSCPHTQLKASGEAVGLPRGEEGSTETGHLNLGAGRIVYQELERINMSVADGTFFENQSLLGAIGHAKKNNSNLHLLGLVGAGWVHSNIEHLFALIRMAKINGITNLYLHIFTDGRDSPPTSAQTYIKKIEDILKREGVGKIASIIGRYWAMDRDERWDRTAKAYFTLTKGQGNFVKSPAEAIKNSYEQGKTDEFIEPHVIINEAGKPLVTIKDGDGVIFFNFRIDRPRQLSKALVLKDFSKADIYDFDPHGVKYEQTHLKMRSKASQPFDRGKALKKLNFVMMTEYGKQLVEDGAKVAFSPEIVKMPLGQVISIAGLKQLRMSESEKERFVTFYFNGLKEESFPQEDRVIIPSPNVSTYDQTPEMSAIKLTGKLIENLKKFKYQLIIVNFANPDMLGHTGNIGPAIKACEVVDDCIGKIADFVLAYKGILLIASDHGNVEEMSNLRTGEIDTEHSTNPVPFIAVSKKFLGNDITLQSGILADVAPTILKLLDIKVPSNMTGRNLLALVSKKYNVI